MSQRSSFAGLRYRHWPRNERGQSLVFITITSAIVILALLVTYNVGQLSFYRIKLQNTADAAAYSAAVASARDLNFAAYMNRGIIANQVVVGQVVSLTGWARNFDNTYNGEYATISETLASLSSLGAMWTTPFNALKSAASPIKSVMDSVGPPLVKGLDYLIKALGYASELYHYAMVASIPLELIPNVVKANEPEASISLMGGAALTYSAYQNYSFATKYTPAEQKDGEDRMARVIDASSDLFYKNRSLPPIWPIPILIDPTRLFTPGFGPILMMQFHSGGSTVKTSAGNSAAHLQGVSSLDATGLFVIMCLTIPIFGIPVPIPFPLPPLPAGAGAAVAGNSNWDSANGLQPANNLEHRNGTNTGVDSAAAVSYGAVHYNPMTAIPAWIKVAEGPGTNMDANAGIKAYLDVKGNATNQTSNQAQANSAATNNNQNIVAPAWVLEIERSMDTYKTSSTGHAYIIGGGTDGKLSLQAGNDHMKALAKAEAYFARPKSLFPRYDGKTEWGSLYSPYWQARLVSNSLAEQAGSILATALF